MDSNSKRDRDKKEDKQKLKLTDNSKCDSSSSATDFCVDIDQCDNDIDLDDENDEYKMNFKNRGLALIFNHKNFDDSAQFKERRGTEKDRDLAKDTLTKLGFAVYIYDDFTREDIKKRLEIAASKLDHTRNDCIVIVVLTHGNENGSLLARDLPYSRQDLYDPFLGSNCKTLIGKPKIFIIQACWGEGLMKGVKQQQQKDDVSSPSSTLPTHSDLFIYTSTWPGFASFRHQESGSFFIQKLMQELSRSAFTLDLISIVLRIQRKMEKQDFYYHGDQKQIPFLQMTCGKKIKFTPKPVLKEGQWPEELRMSSKSPIELIDFAKTTRAKENSALSEIKERGVYKLTNVPSYVVDHLKSAAPLLRHLELTEATFKQLCCLTEMPVLNHLKALSPLKKSTKSSKKCDDSSSTEGEDRQLPDLKLHLQSLEVLLDLRYVEWLLKSSQSTLQKLHLWVGVPVSPKERERGWPKSCNNLEEILKNCELCELKTLQLDRDKKGLFHNPKGCESQKEAVKKMFEGKITIFCSCCDKQDFNQFGS